MSALDDIEVDKDGKCCWGDVANAAYEIEARNAELVAALDRTEDEYEKIIDGLDAKIVSSLERNAKLVAALKAAERHLYAWPAIQQQAREALANQQSTEKP